MRRGLMMRRRTHNVDSEIMMMRTDCRVCGIVEYTDIITSLIKAHVYNENRLTATKSSQFIPKWKN